MSNILVVLVGFIYLGVSIDQFLRGNVPMSIVFAGYAFSNVGFWFAFALKG